MRIHDFTGELGAKRYELIFEAVNLNNEVDVRDRTKSRTLGKLQDKLEAIGRRKGGTDNAFRLQFFELADPGRLILQDNEHELLVELVQSYKVLPLAVRRREDAVSWLEASDELSEAQLARRLQQSNATVKEGEAGEPAEERRLHAVE